MIPILAAASAIDTLDKVATGAMALWKRMSASKADAKKGIGEPSVSFREALASQGAKGDRGLAGGALALDAAFGLSKVSHGKGPAGGHASDHGTSDHAVDQLA